MTGKESGTDQAMAQEDNPASPKFWDVRFRNRRTPWDAASTPLALEQFLQSTQQRGRVLIPGCGAAYEVRSFIDSGFSVTAIDYSEAAVERAQSVLGELSSAVVYGDFFLHEYPDPVFDIIYERAFLASLPRSLWRQYAERVADLLRPGGLLLGFFIHGDQPGGPPFCLRNEELNSLLGQWFEQVENTKMHSSVPVFQGKELWEVWRRR
ncbi:methyltransferase domain-containing protein [Ferrimonas sp. YFM]|uniref:methyltransferase domain-containing protein n=1 Tax=Ferrimonas sp. YFM TaxID=3028878 RepID=UPI002572734B|nr:methyltransferase domain-containing protein [Ferrimonas sp. YFM]BDY04579.1 thiopurine S-methyltransferase [Ferrimonas sp. YFM]